MNLLKSVLVSAVTVLSCQAMALESVEANDYRCSDLQELVRTEGQINIETLHLVETYYAEEPTCTAYEVSSQNSWVWSRNGFCRPGWSCADRQER